MAFNFLKTGSASVKAAVQQKKEAEERKNTPFKLFRFWLKPGEEAKITFVDGELSDQGFLVPSRYYEHNLFLHGTWNNNYVCPEKTNPDAHDSCPICEYDRPSLVALFTIIDHRQFPSKDKTKMYKDTKKLLVVKPQTFELLNKHAQKCGGLAGGTFDVSRVGDKAAAVGSVFFLQEKKPIAELQKIYMKEVKDPKTNATSKETYFTPADYEKEIEYLTGAQLIEKGLGKGGKPQQSPDAKVDEEVDYSKQL